jgi:hypothetical protein
VVLLALKSSILREVSACPRGPQAVLFPLAKFLLEALMGASNSRAARAALIIVTLLILKWNKSLVKIRCFLLNLLDKIHQIPN